MPRTAGFGVIIIRKYSEGEDWVLAGGDRWVRGKGSNGSSCVTMGEGLEKVEFQRKQDGGESFPGMTVAVGTSQLHDLLRVERCA